MEEQEATMEEQPQEELATPPIKTRKPVKKRKAAGRPKSRNYFGGKKEQGNEEEDKVPPKRLPRVPFGSPKQRLTNPGDPRFAYRVFNDNWRKEPDRVARAKAAGYEVVSGYPDISVGTNDDGTAIKGVLMRIPKELYEEDQKAKQKEVDRVDQEIRRGQFQEKAGDKRYIPSPGINIEDKLTP